MKVKMTESVSDNYRDFDSDNENDSDTDTDVYSDRIGRVTMTEAKTETVSLSTIKTE